LQGIYVYFFNLDGDDVSFFWTPSDHLDNANSLTPSATPPEDIVYTLNVVSNSGCVSSTDAVFVKVYKKVIVQNTFSPNGDGINDTWQIDALTMGYPDCKVTIFNRWGGIVYSSTGYETPWDGTIKGDELQTATFYYVIEIKPGDAPIAGSVTIIR
ncbi:MAG: gliding motility-associated C-terminal domain-containing protein, partial [Chitinophagaceae bacterium]